MAHGRIETTPEQQLAELRLAYARYTTLAERLKDDADPLLDDRERARREWDARRIAHAYEKTIASAALRMESIHNTHVSPNGFTPLAKGLSVMLAAALLSSGAAIAYLRPEIFQKLVPHGATPPPVTMVEAVVPTAAPVMKEAPVTKEVPAPVPAARPEPAKPLALAPAKPLALARALPKQAEAPIVKPAATKPATPETRKAPPPPAKPATPETRKAETPPVTAARTQTPAPNAAPAPAQTAALTPAPTQTQTATATPVPAAAPTPSVVEPLAPPRNVDALPKPPESVAASANAEAPVKEAVAPPRPVTSAKLVPVLRTHLLPPYPTDAKKAGEQGTTQMEVSISVQGAITDCRVIGTSGSQRLDATACSFVQRYWRWLPPTREGHEIATTTKISVIWNLVNSR